MYDGWEVVLRLVLASCLGACVGLEREVHGRPAGLRTYLILSLGSCLIMVVSEYLAVHFHARFPGLPMQFDPGRIAAQAVTGTRVLAIKKDDFLHFLAGHPQVTLSIINVLGGRLRDAANRLKDLAGERVEQRLARILLMLSAKLGKTLPFTRQEIADMAGMTTETTIRLTTQLKERGIISTVRGKITIVDELKLRLLAEGPPRV